ncbi:MAG TPA: YsnF/AvaK domain-containing protein [Steroidobacteraceae bacterium]|nr:YsnF/AvaK domain-containing protein [Steroidobacteraceae bacterium]
MNTRTITALFDSADAASRARDRLLEIGVPSDGVQVIDQRGAVGSDGSDGSDGKGLWESIKDFFTGDDDNGAVYEEGIRRGGHLLTARVADEHVDEAIIILENSDAIDLDRRAEDWRAEGWAGARTQATTQDVATREPIGSTQAGAEEAIPVVQERLRVGKREVNRGSVRVRSYVVEEPIQEQVNLRQERVDVERRPVGQRVRPGAADDLLRDRTVEMTESAEEAVVSKDAEVTEEVVVRKFEGERTEGVSDTVRRTEVEVEDTRDDETTRGDSIPPAAGKRSRSSRTDRPPRQ